MNPAISDQECRLYAYLTTYDFKMSGECWPGRERAAADLQWSVRTLDRALSGLDHAGAIARHQAGNGRPAWLELLADLDPAGPDMAALPDSDDSLAKSRKRTSIEREKNEGTAEKNGGPDERIQKLVAGYVDDYRVVCNGHEPSARWRGAAGRAVKTALADGEDPDDIAICLSISAKEGKNPTTLPNILSDMHANRPRRPIR
jgi:hypothetical protein